MRVPFSKPNITQTEIDAVVSVLKSGWLTTGQITKDFEAAFSQYTTLSHSVALNSCTAGLHLGLEACGVKRGDHVVVPSLTFAASAEVVRYLDATPLLVDVREEDFGIDVKDAKPRIQSVLAKGSPVTAIIPVHYGGQACDMAGVKRLAKEFNLKIIEDAAHCCPARYVRESDKSWVHVGTESDVTCFSFYANKPITTGEGGMACTNDPILAERMRLMGLHGISKDAWKRYAADGNWYYEIIEAGYKYNLTDIASAIGLAQLGKATELHEKRKKLARVYTDALSKIEEIILPTELPGRDHSWHLYVIRVTDGVERNQFISGLNAAGIQPSVHWMPLHMHPYYRKHFGYKPEDIPTAQKLFNEIVTLPMFPDMTPEEVQLVVDEVAKQIRASSPKVFAMSGK